MASKNPYKHTFNVVVELDGADLFADLFEIKDPDSITSVVRGLQDRMKKSYFHCKKPEKIFLYMLATDDMGIVYKMTRSDDGEADK